jgi:hypothetical protein
MSTRQLVYRSLLFILLFVVCSLSVTGTDFRFSDSEIGPIVVSVQIKVRIADEQLTAFPKKVAELTATGRNLSKQPIRYAKFCVQAGRRTKGCDFELWTDQVWMPGQELLWMADRPARPGIEKPTILVLVKFKPATETSKR